MFSIFGNKGNSDRDGQDGQDPPGLHVRAMKAGDINAVVAIIKAHDEDDGEEAAESFAETLEAHYVAVDNGVVVGVGGVAFDDETETSCWLSWTYVKDDYRRQGIGRLLVGKLFEDLRVDGISKVFVSTGDYVENGQDIYAPAKAFYQAMGGRLELKIDDYYERGEASYIYGFELGDLSGTGDAAPAGYLTFDDLVDVGEAKDGAFLSWREFSEADRALDPAKQLNDLIARARSAKARFILAAFPSDLRNGAEQGLAAAGFQQSGQLGHYYGLGVHQVHWIFRIHG